MRGLRLAERCTKELIRDPLSWIFCLVFPFVMLAIMTLLYESIPGGMAPQIFRVDHLAPGIAVFSFCFLTLFSAMLLSRDRGTTLFDRLRITPATATDLLLGYALPLGGIALAQIGITFIAASVIGAWTDTAISAGRALLSGIALLPSLLIFIPLGLLLGALLRDQAASGISSILISVASLFGGVWMDVDTIGGTLAGICRALPFYHAVRLARCAMQGVADGAQQSLIVVLLYGGLCTAAAVLVVRNKWKNG